MRRLFLLLAALIALATVCSCHNTRRQYYRTIDGVHDVLLEGT